MSSSDDLLAWLALEHEAVWLYPVLGARFSALTANAKQSFTAHRDTRDALLARLDALQVEPVPTRLSYQLGPLSNLRQAQQAARDVEAQISAACLRLAGSTTGEERAHAVKNLRKAARAEMTWGGQPRAFPGLP